MKMTEKDLITLNVIKNYIDQHGYSPSYREIGELLGISSTNSVWERMQRLYCLGLIETDTKEHAPRAFRLKRGENNVGE